jgi:hypothetical protein
VVVPTIIGIIGSKLLVNSWQIRKEKFALRREILTNFQETWPFADSIIYGLYMKVSSAYTTIPLNAKYESGTISADWLYPTNESERPFNKFQHELQELTGQLSQIAYKISGFRGLIVLYFENSENLTKIFNELRKDVHEYHLHLNRMINAKNLDELMGNNNKLLELRNPVLVKIQDMEKLLIETKLKNPKD